MSQGYTSPTMANKPRRTPLGKNRRAELGVIDYTLAKRALLRDAQVGVIGMTDICDAHPELIRAARHVGEPTKKDCPVCGKVKLVLLAYVYGDALRDQNGRVWSIETGLKMAAANPGAALLRRRGLHRVPLEPPARGLHGPSHRGRLRPDGGRNPLATFTGSPYPAAAPGCPATEPPR